MVSVPGMGCKKIKEAVLVSSYFGSNVFSFPLIEDWLVKEVLNFDLERTSRLHKNLSDNAQGNNNSINSDNNNINNANDD